MKTAVIYTRVSTTDQNPEVQLRELKAFAKRAGYQLVKIYTDHGYSGASTKRPAFLDMLEAAQRRQFKTLIVWKLDRLSRSLKDLVNTLADLHSYNIDFVSYTDKIDTSSAAGKMIFQITAVFAEFERDLIRERVKSGLANARAKGVRLGRPAISGRKAGEIKDLAAQGMNKRQIARQLRIDDKTVRKYLKG